MSQTQPTPGQRSVQIHGDANGTVIITGDANGTVIITGDQDIRRRATEHFLEVAHAT